MATTAISSASPYTRRSLALSIAERIRADRDALGASWVSSAPVRHCVIDALLPADVAALIPAAFPSEDVLRPRDSMRERKRVGVEVERYDPLVGELLFAFQEPEVIEAVASVVGLPGMEPDPTLYASGLSAMREGDFLNPHLDNSHDGDQRRYRVLNLLYYVTPDWKLANGGNLELWEPTVKQQVTVEARFNRLVLMLTDRQSWHSVSKVVVPGRRMCVSNYYFAATPPDGAAYKHVTTFSGRPEETFKRVALGVIDGWLLNTIGRRFPSLLKRTKHRRGDAPPPASGGGAA